MPSLTQNFTHVGDWECVTCCEDYNTVNDSPWQTEDAGSLVCGGCIIHLFEQALENDYSWPPRFGPDVLHSQDFASHLPSELLDRVTRRVAQAEPRIKPEEVAEATKGLVRGKDYQICPGCSLVVALKESCNHIACVCPLGMKGFCFICGQVAQHDDDHLRKGGYPRFGQPAAERAIFDPPNPIALAREAHNARIQRELAQDLTIFHADSWTWNVAMQTLASDDDTRRLMVDLLRGTPSRLYWTPTLEEHSLVLKAMQAQNPLHRVPDDQWDLVVANSTNTIECFVAEGPRGARRDATRHPAVARGLLWVPVSGLFNMASQSGRVAAFMWMHDSIRSWENINYRSVKNVAVFDMGPATDDETRFAGANLMAFLFLFGKQHMQGRFSFELMAGNALLVELNPPPPVNGRPDALYSEAYWRQELLTNLWHRMAYPDQQPVVGDEQWTKMWRDASHAWYEQTGAPIHSAL